MNEMRFCYANMAIHGVPLGNFRMGPGHQKHQPHDQRVETLDQSNFSGGGEGLEIEFNHVASDLINYAYVMKP